MQIQEFRQYALSLPEAHEEPHFQSGSFRIRGKIFATVPPGDEVAHIFVDAQLQEQLTTMYPEFCEKLWWGKKVLGVCVQLSRADPGEVKQMLLAAWKRKAPKKLQAEM